MENDAIRGGTGVPEPEVPEPTEGDLQFPAGGANLAGTLAIPDSAVGLVLFAHGSGSSRRSPRNRAVAQELRRAGLATMLMDLLTAEEEAADERTGKHRFDIELLSARLIGAMDWLASTSETGNLPLGLFGASTGAAAALVAASERPDTVRAVVSRGGRPDLAGEALEQVKAPTLLIVGGRDDEVLQLNRVVVTEIPGETSLEVVPGAGHLFEEPGAMARVARLASEWFVRHLPDRHQSLGRNRAVPEFLPGEEGAPPLPPPALPDGANVPPAPPPPVSVD